MPDYRWDIKLHRFRDARSGRFVSFERIRVFQDEFIAASREIAAGFAEAVSAGEMGVDAWYLAMKGEIKGEYIRQYLLGRGGYRQMTASDWGKVGSQIQEQYKYLKGFQGEIAEGTVPEGMLRNRAQMYLNSAREAFEAANQKVQKEAGFDIEAWVVDDAVENCDDCLGFAAMGWVKIEDNPYGGAVPGSGDTKCLTHCHCHIEYGKSGEQ